MNKQQHLTCAQGHIQSALGLIADDLLKQEPNANEIRASLEKALRQMKSNFEWDSQISGIYTIVFDTLDLLKQEPCSLCGGSKNIKCKKCEALPFGSGMAAYGKLCGTCGGKGEIPCPDCTESQELNFIEIDNDGYDKPNHKPIKLNQEALTCPGCTKQFPLFMAMEYQLHVDNCKNPPPDEPESQEPVEECRKQLAKAEKDIKDINETDKYSETVRAELLHDYAVAAINHHLKTCDRLEAETEANAILAKAKENIANENEKLRTKLQVSNKRLADSENCVLIGDKFLKEYKVKLEAVEGHRDRLIAWCGEYAASPACMMERLQAAEKRADAAEKELEQRLGIIREQEGIIKRWGKEIKQLQERNVTLRFQFRELQAEKENLRQYAGGLENAQGFLDEKISNLELKLKSAEGEIEKRKKWMDVELGKYHLSDDQALGRKGDSNA